MARVIGAFVCSFAIGMVLAGPIVFFLKRLNAKQSILSYVEQHKAKQGIPTMGGFIFLFPCLITFFLYRFGQSDLATMTLIITFAYGLIGALDDGVKILLKRNLGLKAYQKIISQAVFSILITYYCYKNQYIGSDIVIPFLNVSVNIGKWYLPFCFVLFIATTNAVNLTDGLDGLAGSISAIYIFTLSVIIATLWWQKEQNGQTFFAQEMNNLLILSFSMLGGLAAFLWQNAYKAKVFMGDTGSLALGGMCCMLSVAVRQPFLIALVGIVFVISAFSVIIQVLVYKIKKKRVFLMAPLHHHLEMRGYNESKIVSYYVIVTVFFGAMGIISVLI